jgi:hypothetical protein
MKFNKPHKNFEKGIICKTDINYLLLELCDYFRITSETVSIKNFNFSTSPGPHIRASDQTPYDLSRAFIACVHLDFTEKWSGCTQAMGLRDFLQELVARRMINLNRSAKANAFVLIFLVEKTTGSAVAWLP